MNEVDERIHAKVMITIQEKAFSRKIFKKRFDSLLDFYKGARKEERRKTEKSD